MKSNWTTLAFIAVFLAALSGGTMTGIVASRLMSARHQPSTNSTVAVDAPLAEQLALSDSQRQQMREIWAAVRDLSDQSFASAQAAKSDEEQAIAALIPSDKLEEYRKIQRDYVEKCAGLKGRRQAAFEKAVEQTRQILTDPQREKYNAILKRRLGPDGDVREHDPLNPAASVSSTLKRGAVAVALND